MIQLKQPITISSCHRMMISHKIRLNQINKSRMINNKINSNIPIKYEEKENINIEEFFGVFLVISIWGIILAAKIINKKYYL